MDLNIEKLRDVLPQNSETQRLESCWQEYFDLYANTDFSLAYNIQIGTLKSSTGETVYQYYKQTSDSLGTCIIVHGYMDHSGLYMNLIKWQLEQGWDVLIYDKLGHGLSSGEYYAINDFSEYAQQLNEVLTWLAIQENTKSWMLIGQSTGAAVMMEYLLNDQFNSLSQIKRHVLLAPLLRNKPFIKTKLKFQVLRHFLNKVKKGSSSSSHDQKFLEFINHKDPLAYFFIKVSWLNAMIAFEKRFNNYLASNVLLEVVQGDDDQTVDWQYNLQAIERKFPNSRYSVIKGAKHNLVNETEKYRLQVFKLIT